MAKIEPNNRTPKPKFNIFWIYGLIALFIIGWGMLNSSGNPLEITWATFKNQVLATGDVKKVEVINKEVVEVYLKPDKIKEWKQKADYKNMPASGPQFVFTIGSLEKFENDLEQVQESLPESARISPVFVKKRSIWSDVWTVFPFLLIILFTVIMMRNMSRGSGGGGGGVFNVGKAKAQVFDKDSQMKVTFKDVAGMEGAKTEIMEIVDFLRNPKKYNDLGGKIPKGALLVGPPGTGKTLLAKAVAGEANVPFFSISGSDFVEMFVGVGASRVRDLFRQAKEKAPCIVFIDEIDAIGRARSKNAGYSSNDERENTLNQLLTEMDGFATNAGVIILAATNRADILDKALMRAGRFDRQIHVELPDLTERRDIFDVHLKRLKLDPNLDREFLAKHTPGFSGADIANVCNEAALIAARGNKTQVERQDFLDAIDRIVGGLERRSTIISDQEKRSIAFHEAGHATVSWLLKYANPLIKVTIIPRGRALGAAWYLPDERHITTKEQLLDEMAATLGGRAAEEIFLGRISTGALNDLERVTRQAYAMISYFGMSDSLGNISYYDSTGQSDMGLTKPYSDKTAQQIDSEVKALIDSTYQKAKSILEEHRTQMEQLAEKLLEREVIFTEDVEEILGKRPSGHTPEGVKPETQTEEQPAAQENISAE